MGRFRQGKIIGLAVAVCLIVICGVLLWRAKPHKTEETLVISHALKEDKGSNTTHKKQAEKNRQTPTAMPTATPTATPQGGYAEITSHDKMKIYEDTATVVIGDTGYELYNYVPSIASSYAKAINKAAKLYGSSATIYDIIIPTSVGITMPDNKLAHVNSTPQDKAIKKIFAKLEKSVQTISLSMVAGTPTTEMPCLFIIVQIITGRPKGRIMDMWEFARSSAFHHMRYQNIKRRNLEVLLVHIMVTPMAIKIFAKMSWQLITR